MLNSLETVGLTSPMSSLSLISWPDAARSRCRIASWLAWKAATASKANPMTRAMRNAMKLSRRRARRWSAAAGVEEVPFDLAEGRVAGRIGADPGRGFRRGRQQGPGIEIGRVAGVADPFGGNVVQAGADDTVGVGFGEPHIAQQRPCRQQDLVADLHVPAARMSSRSAAKASRTASTSRASAALLPSVSSALIARAAV